MARWALLSGRHPLGRALTAQFRERSDEPDFLDLDAEMDRWRGSWECLVLLPASSFLDSPLDGPRLQAALRFASSAAPRLIVLSSTAVHAVRAGHPGMVAESALVRARGDDPESAGWLALEEATSAGCSERGSVLTILRCAPVPLAGGGDAVSRWLRQATVCSALGFDPRWQLLDVGDLAGAIAAARDRSQAAGCAHIVPRGVVPLHRAIALCGARRLPLPAGLLALLRRLRSRLRPHQPGLDPARLCFTATASGETARRQLRWEATRTSGEALQRQARRVASSPYRGAAVAAEPATKGWDDFGYDRAFCDRCARTVWRFAHDVWWRIGTEGAENLPRSGPAVIAGLHRGWAPYDGMMMLHVALAQVDRPIRFLIHPALQRTPFIGDWMAKWGGVVATNDNAATLLGRGELVGILPEGVRGAFTELRSAYEIQSFGRHDFLRIAMRSRAPIVPIVAVGPAEAMPIWRLWPWSWWRRRTGWPGLPLSPTFPHGLPLPSKWHLRILPPMVEHLELPPEAADDHRAVRRLGSVFRHLLAAEVGDLLRRRPSVWRGSLAPGSAGR